LWQELNRYAEKYQFIPPQIILSAIIIPPCIKVIIH
jgi:hypothetical protein